MELLMFLLGVFIMMGEALGFSFVIDKYGWFENEFLSLFILIILLVVWVYSFISLPLFIYYNYTLEGLMISNTRINYEKYKDEIYPHIHLNITYKDGLIRYWQKNIRIDGILIYQNGYECTIPRIAKKQIKEKVKYSLKRHYEETSKAKYDAVSKFYRQ